MAMQLEFEIIVSIDGVKYKMGVEQLKALEEKERYLVFAQQGQKRITLETNAPMLRRHGLDTGQWEIIEGGPMEKETAQAIGRAITDKMNEGFKKMPRRKR